MYFYVVHILHNSSLGVCFAKRSRIASKWQGAIVVFEPSFYPVLRKVGRVGIGHDVVLVFGFSSAIINMKSIDMYILYDSSLGICFSKRSQITGGKSHPHNSKIQGKYRGSDQSIIWQLFHQSRGLIR